MKLRRIFERTIYPIVTHTLENEFDSEINKGKLMWNYVLKWLIKIFSELKQHL